MRRETLPAMNAAKRSYRTPTPEVWEDRWCDAALLKNEKLGIRFFIQDVVMVSLSFIYVALEAHWRRIEAQIGAHEAQIGAAGVLLIWLTWVDRRTERLPNVLVGALAALAGVAWLTGALPVGGVNALLGVLVGGGALWGLAALMERLTGRSGLGLGEVKMLAALGAWAGGVAFEGAVYNMRHGPQPLSVGNAWFENKHGRPWTVTLNGQPEQPQTDYKGHRYIKGGHAEIMYDLVLADGRRR